jgi:uracil-DNA glycosylase
MTSLKKLNQHIARCRKCPRLVKHREAVAAHPPARHQGEKYWGRPVPGFGDPQASIYIVGLAPAANGGNRTGRIFTGDRSGDWLYSALHAVGLANQPESVSRNDGLKLQRVYIGAAVRCAPPDNKPLLDEFENCRPYLAREYELLPQARVLIALGSIAYQSLKKVLRQKSDSLLKFRFPPFKHGLQVELPNGQTLLCSYHPSQQNTFTGKLTRPMFLSVFRNAVALTGV